MQLIIESASHVSQETTLNHRVEAILETKVVSLPEIDNH